MTYDGKFNINASGTVKIPSINAAMDNAAAAFSTDSFMGGYYFSPPIYTDSDNVYYINSSTNTLSIAPKSDPLNAVKRHNLQIGGQAEFFSNVTDSPIGNWYYSYGTLDDLGGANGTNIWKAHKDTPTAWVDTGSSIPANTHFATIYSDGSNIYLIGGYDANLATYTNTIDVASISTPTTFVTSANVLPAIRAASAFTQVGSNLYLIGGSADGGTSENTIYTASTSDPTTWTDTLATLPRPIMSAAIYNDGTNIYLYGGTDSTAALDLDQIYVASVSSPTTFVLSGTTLPAAITRAKLFIVGSYMYMIGAAIGSGTGIMRASVSDPLTWTNVTNGYLATNQTSTHLIKTDTKVYAIGGFSSGSRSTVIQSADISRPLEWSNEIDVLPAALGGGQLIKTKNYYYLIGADGVTGNYYRAPISTPTVWALVDNTGPTRTRGKAVIIDDHVYYFGGETEGPSTPVSTGWRASIQDGEVVGWKSSASLYLSTAAPTSISRYALIVAGDYVYILGGYVGGGIMNTNIYRAQKSKLNGYSGITRWVTVGTITNTMVESSVAIINDRVYIISGGPNDSFNTSDDYVLSASMNSLAAGVASFTEENTAGPPIAGAAAICLNDDLYMFGGRTSTNGTTNIYRNFSWATHALVNPEIIESTQSIPTFDITTGNYGMYTSFQRLGMLPWLISNK